MHSGLSSPIPTGSRRENVRPIPHRKRMPVSKAPTADRRRSGHGEYNGQGLDNGRINAPKQAREAKLKPCWENQSSDNPEINTSHRLLENRITIFYSTLSQL